MNKISLTILVVAAMLLTFAGCKRDKQEPPTPPMSNNQGESTNTTNSGIYNPEKKISKIFYENSNTEGKQLRETWTWDGDLLSKITDRDGNVTQFEYDNKRIKTVKFSYGGRMEFTYDGKKVKKCNYYTSEGIGVTYTFTCDGSKISKIDMKYTCYSELFSLDIKWTGNNINQSIFKVTYEDEDEDEDKEVTDFTYDDYYNPFYGSLFHFVNDLDRNGTSMSSQNNLITRVAKYTSGEIRDRRKYTYTYDSDKFPTKIREDCEEGRDSYDGYYYITYIEYQ